MKVVVWTICVFVLATGFVVLSPVIAIRGFTFSVEPSPKAMAGSTALAEPPRKVFGEYAGAGCPNDDSSCVSTTTSDSVKIVHDTDREARARVHIIYPGQSCSIEGAVFWRSDHFTLKAQGLDQDKPCELFLNIKDSLLTLQDPDQRCREVYCGTRGTFDGTRFKHR